MAIFRELPVLYPKEGDPELRAGTSPSTSVLPPVRPLSPSKAREILASKKPEWLKIRPPGGEAYTQIKGLLRQGGLHTVCEEAHCPNVAECWASGTATFMVGSDTCTRACRFCAVKTARIPPPLDPDEPAKVAASVATLGLHYVVLTTVDRDDLPDQGSEHIAATIREIKRLDPKIIVEALVGDFRGDRECVARIVASGVDVYAHNVETVKRLHARVRDPRATYAQSLGVLRAAKLEAEKQKRMMFTKSSLMLGLGETDEELNEAFDDMRSYDIDVLTLGQYLRPSMSHLPVERYVSPAQFDALAEVARGKGFMYVAAGPMVRSSYKAGEFFIQGMIEKRRKDGTQTS